MRTFSARSLQRILDYYRGSGEIDWMAISTPLIPLGLIFLNYGRSFCIMPKEACQQINPWAQNS